MTGSFLALLVSGCVVYTDGDPNLEVDIDDFTVTEDFDRVSVSWETGDVTLSGSDAPGEGEIVYRYRHEPADVDWWVSNHTLYLQSDCPRRLNNRCSADLDLTVPYDTRLMAELITGDLSVRDLERRADIDLTTGDVRLFGMAGALDIHMTTGDLVGDGLTSLQTEVRLTTGQVILGWDETPDSIDVDVTTGDVLLTVPHATYACDVDITTGSESVTGIVDDPTASRTIKVEVVTGDVDIVGYQP